MGWHTLKGRKLPTTDLSTDTVGASKSPEFGNSTPDKLIIKGVTQERIIAVGHGSRQSCRTDKFGFHSRHVPRNKIHFGFQTGDIVKAIVTTGKKVGEYVGKVALFEVGAIANTKVSHGLLIRYNKSIPRATKYGRLTEARDRTRRH